MKILKNKLIYFCLCIYKKYYQRKNFKIVFVTGGFIKFIFKEIVFIVLSFKVVASQFF